MTAPRFLHAADLHLGAPLASLSGDIPAEKAAHLRTLARGAFDDLVDRAVEADVAFVVLAGDIYDDAHREVAAQVRFARGLEALHGAGIPVFVVHGNHDPLVGSYRPAAALPPNVVVFGPGDVAVHEVGLADGSAVAVAGVSFGTAHERENLALRFRDLDVGGLRCVGVLHANVAGTVGHDPYAPCSTDDLRAAPVTYWALGHVHQRTGGELGPGRRWAYPGNLQGRSTKPSECGPKGAVVVSLGHDGVGEPELVVCDRLRFERVDVDVTEAADVPAVLDLVVRSVADAVAGADGRPVVLRARLVGATASHRHLLDAGDQLLDLGRESCAHLLGDGDVARVEVATRPAVERTRLLQRGDLLSSLLRALDDVRAGGDVAVEDLLGPAVERLGPAAAHAVERLAASDPDHASRILDAVERRFLDELVVHG